MAWANVGAGVGERSLHGSYSTLWTSEQTNDEIKIFDWDTELAAGTFGSNVLGIEVMSVRIEYTASATAATRLPVMQIRDTANDTVFEIIHETGITASTAGIYTWCQVARRYTGITGPQILTVENDHSMSGFPPGLIIGPGMDLRFTGVDDADGDVIPTNDVLDVHLCLRLYH